ncbi:MAG: CvpA family protein [Bacteroidetes bacterium]|nr:CvpA family protein [Bacteroidota bacterium]
MNILDIVIGIPLALAVISGFKNGFIYEIASLAGLILGIYIAINFSGYMSDFLEDMFHWHGRTLWFLSLLFTFVLVVISIRLLGKVMESVVESLAMGPLNHLFGGVISVIKTAFVLSLIIYLLNLVDSSHTLISQTTKEKSYLWNPVSEVAPFIMPQLDKRAPNLKDPKPGEEKEKKEA